MNSSPPIPAANHQLATRPAVSGQRRPASRRNAQAATTADSAPTSVPPIHEPNSGSSTL